MMKTSRGSRAYSVHPWVLAALFPLSLAACGTAGGVPGAMAGSQAVDVGYGQVGRDQITGSVATLRSEDIAAQQGTLADMLARIPGVRVIHLSKLYGGISVRIRSSNNSMVGGEEPLFLLDGMPIPTGNGEIFGINPNAIESITVLKDAGQTAIYGSRGANGVILIKTKSGG